MTDLQTYVTIEIALSIGHSDGMGGDGYGTPEEWHSRWQDHADRNAAIADAGRILMLVYDAADDPDLDLMLATEAMADALYTAFVDGVVLDDATLMEWAEEACDQSDGSEED